MSGTKSFEDLIVWQKAHALVLDVYQITDAFPKAEQFGVTSQMRRAAYSIPSNIAEGFAKRGTKDKLRFYNIAQGSAQELRYFIILTSDLGYQNLKAELLEKLDEVGKLLSSYMSKIHSNS